MDFTFDMSLVKEYAAYAGLAVSLIILIYVGLYVINRLSRLLRKRLLSLKLRSLKTFNLEIINVGKIKLVINTLISSLQLLLYGFFIYFMLIVILSKIPATEEISIELYELIFVPLQAYIKSFVSYIPDLFNIAVMIVIAHYLIKSVKYISNGVESGSFHFPGFKPRTARTTGGIITFLIYVLTIIVILPSMPGYESLAFKGIATFIGALVTIGGSSIIANYMAGIVLTYMHAFDKGNWVEIDGISGQIKATGPFAIRLKSYKEEAINIPNSKVLSSAIRNFSKEGDKGMLIYTEVSIGYDVHSDEVISLLIKAANKTEFLDNERSPFVFIKKLDDFYIVYELNAYINDPTTKPEAYSLLHANILELFNEAQIEIMSPHYRAERDGSPSTLIEKA